MHGQKRKEDIMGKGLSDLQKQVLLMAWTSTSRAVVANKSKDNEYTHQKRAHAQRIKNLQAGNGEGFLGITTRAGSGSV